MVKKVKCPQCGKPTFFSPDNPNRPFCSERCKILDLGDWAQEKYRVPSEEGPRAADSESTKNFDPDDEI